MVSKNQNPEKKANNFLLLSLLSFLILLIITVSLYILKAKKVDIFTFALPTASEVVKNIEDSGLIPSEKATGTEEIATGMEEIATNTVEEIINEVPTGEMRITPPLSISSFGDNFSSNVYLDLAKTNMFFDETVTSLIFPPLYNFNKVKTCEGEKCFANVADQILFNAEENKCLKNSCLKVSDIKILLNNKNINYPDDLADKKVINVSVSTLSSRWIVSFVFNNGKEEEAYVYFFNGQKFIPIINQQSKEKIITHFGYGKGSVVAGGVDDDFLIFYAGYEDLVYHYKKEKLYNVSRFFGLRVSTIGFKPQIIRQGDGKNTLWYLVGSSNYGFKMVKLWQNGTESIKGSYYFNNIFSKADGTLFAVKKTNNRTQLDFSFKDNTGKFSLWRFSDLGFDNSIDRAVTSINLINYHEVVYRAIIKEIGLAVDCPLESDYEIHFPNSKVKLFLANARDQFIEAKPQIILSFPKVASELFWRAEFKKGDNNEYSPWLDNINYLDYFFANK